MDPVITDRYVKALLSAATNLSHQKLVEQDLTSLKIELHRSGLKSFLENPRYPLVIKLRAIQKIGELFSSSLTKNFLKILLLHSRIGLLEYISERYVELYRESKGIILCKISLAKDPTQKFLDQIEKELKRITGKSVELQIKIDPSLLGGIRLKIKNNVLDGTYRRNIELMKDRLLEGQYT